LAAALGDTAVLVGRNAAAHALLIRVVPFETIAAFSLRDKRLSTIAANVINIAAP